MNRETLSNSKGHLLVIHSVISSVMVSPTGAKFLEKSSASVVLKAWISLICYTEGVGPFVKQPRIPCLTGGDKGASQSSATGSEAKQSAL